MKFKIGDYVKIKAEWHLSHGSLGIISNIDNCVYTIDIISKANILNQYSYVTINSERLLLANENETHLIDSLVTFK